MPTVCCVRDLGAGDAAGKLYFLGNQMLALAQCGLRNRAWANQYIPVMAVAADKSNAANVPILCMPLIRKRLNEQADDGDDNNDAQFLGGTFADAITLIS